MPRAPIPDKQKRRIRQLLEEGKSPRQVAKLTQVSRTAIRKIKAEEKVEPEQESARPVLPGVPRTREEVEGKKPTKKKPPEPKSPGGTTEKKATEKRARAFDVNIDRSGGGQPQHNVFAQAAAPDSESPDSSDSSDGPPPPDGSGDSRFNPLTWWKKVKEWVEENLMGDKYEHPHTQKVRDKFILADGSGTDWTKAKDWEDYLEYAKSFHEKLIRKWAIWLPKAKREAFVLTERQVKKLAKLLAPLAWYITRWMYGESPTFWLALGRWATGVFEETVLQRKSELDQ